MNGNDGPTSPILSELSIRADKPAPVNRTPELPPIPGSLAHSSARGETIRVDGGIRMPPK